MFWILKYSVFTCNMTLLREIKHSKVYSVQKFNSVRSKACMGRHPAYKFFCVHRFAALYVGISYFGSLYIKIWTWFEHD